MGWQELDGVESRDEAPRALLRKLADHLRNRVWAVLFVALAALWAHRRAPQPPAPTVEGLAGMLGRAAAAEVQPDALVWEPSRGVLIDLLWGRRVLFLATAEGQTQRDLYRARVRVSRDGHPIVVRRVHNLTQTALGDERQLRARERYVAFATEARGGMQGVTVLDLHGEGLADVPWRARLWAQLDNWLRLGSAAGLGRRELVFVAPPAQLQLELRDELLVLALGEPPEAASLQLPSAALDPGPQNSHQASAWAVPRKLRLPQRVLMDGVRGWLGPESADALEIALLDARDHRLAEPGAAPPSEPAPPPPSPMGEAWPPAPLAPRVTPPLEHEGRWLPAPIDWLPPAPEVVGEAQPYLLQTVFRPSAEQPSATVRMVAIDTRQLELRMAAGVSWPHASTGPRGRGRIAQDERAATVAAFNGGCRTRCDNSGMVVERRVLLPPQDGAATVATDRRGRSYLGVWRQGEALPPQLVSLRQSGPPLIAGGALNPSGHTQWGAPDGDRVLAERSALCRTGAGYLIYAWGSELTAATLGHALLAAGCRDAMHLDTTAGHVGFSFLQLQQDAPKSALLAPQMSSAPERFATASAGDFFYLVLRRHLPSVAGGTLKWTPAAGRQPLPAWLPAVYRASTERLGAEVEVLAIAADRFTWQIRPGHEERFGQTSAAPLSEQQLSHTLLALGLGVAARGDNKRGLALNGVRNLPLRADRAVLATPANGVGLTLGRAPADMAPAGDASELMLWAERGELRSEARQLGRRRQRRAACQLRDGTLLLASAVFDSGEAVTRALMDIGCRRVIELNRGRQLRAFMHRAGTDALPEAAYDDTVLYASEAPLRGTALPLSTLHP